MMQEEYHMQVALIYWIRIKYPNMLVTIAPNGMKLSIGVATKLKRAGYSKGTPDIMIFEPNWEYHGLFIELKTAKGRISPEQLLWIESLKQKGYQAIVCRSFDEARKEIIKYLSK